MNSAPKALKSKLTLIFVSSRLLSPSSLPYSLVLSITFSSLPSAPPPTSPLPLCSSSPPPLHLINTATVLLLKCRERIKFSQLREVFTQLQKSNQHLEKELEKRKEREAELLTFSAKLSSSNAELTAERSGWEAKVKGHHCKKGWEWGRNRVALCIRILSCVSPPLFVSQGDKSWFPTRCFGEQQRDRNSTQRGTANRARN